MFCKNCGNRMNDGAKFCAKCGCKVEDINQQYPKSEMQLESQQAVQTTTQIFNQIPVQVTTNEYEKSMQSVTSQPYVYQNNVGKKTKKSFSPIGIISFFGWFIVLFLIDFAFAGDKSFGNLAFGLECLFFGILTYIDFMKGNEKYNKGLSIATFCICVICVFLICMFG